jgi:plasmid maintenance system killer protein
MDLSFKADELDRLEVDAVFTAGFAPAVVAAFRRRIQLLRAMTSDAELKKWRCLDVQHAHGLYSVRLHGAWRLLFRVQGTPAQRRLCIEALVDSAIQVRRKQ